jgi:hypothetical protein
MSADVERIYATCLALTGAVFLSFCVTTLSNMVLFYSFCVTTLSNMVLSYSLCVTNIATFFLSGSVRFCVTGEVFR